MQTDTTSTREGYLNNEERDWKRINSFVETASVDDSCKPTHYVHTNGSPVKSALGSLGTYRQHELVPYYAMHNVYTAN